MAGGQLRKLEKVSVVAIVPSLKTDPPHPLFSDHSQLFPWSHPSSFLSPDLLKEQWEKRKVCFVRTNYIKLFNTGWICNTKSVLKKRDLYFNDSCSLTDLQEVWLDRKWLLMADRGFRFGFWRLQCPFPVYHQGNSPSRIPVGPVLQQCVQTQRSSVWQAGQVLNKLTYTHAHLCRTGSARNTVCYLTNL